MKKNPQKKAEKPEKPNLLLRVVSAAIVVISVLNIFFSSEDSAIRWFQLLTGIAFLLTAAGTAYDLMKNLRVARAEEIEPLREINNTPPRQIGRIWLDGLIAVVLSLITALLAFTHFWGLSLRELLVSIF